MFYFIFLDTVTFDNSYSLLRSKKLHYIVYVTQPLNEVDMSGIKPNEDADTNGNENGTSPKSNGDLGERLWIVNIMCNNKKVIDIIFSFYKFCFVCSINFIRFYVYLLQIYSSTAKNP